MQLEDMSNAELIALVKRQEQELATSVGVTAAELSCVINWLEGGRDPKDAAKELRLYCERAWTRAQPVARLPKWIDDQKGSDPNTDALIEYIEHLRGTQPVQQPAPVARQKPYGWLTGESSMHRQGTLEEFTSNHQFALDQCAEYNSSCTDDPDHVDRVPVPLYSDPVPAASVQPETDKRPDFGRDGYGRLTAEWHSANNKICIGFDGKGNMTWAVYADNTSLEYGNAVVDEAATVIVRQPDSGRDAGLVDLIERTIERLSRAQIFDFVTEWRSYLAAHPANVAQAQAEQRQRERMTQLFADRKPSAATADFDLPAPNDAIDVAQPVSDAALRVLECYAENYEMMARTTKDGTVDCSSVAHDIRRNMIDGVRAALAAHIPTNVAQVGEDQIITQRDAYQDVADNLANAIAAHFGVGIGEHSSANCPWTEALRVIEEAGQVGELSDAEIADCTEALKLWEYMTCDDPTADRLLIAFGRAILAAAKKGPTT